MIGREMPVISMPGLAGAESDETAAMGIPGNATR
jgi:hypothetical protein